MTWTVGVTLAIALVGAVLGIINTWHQINRDQVKLRVTPMLVDIFRGKDVSHSNLCIEVINFSAFAVTVKSVGFSAKGADIALPDPILMDRGSWPRRLEPRQSVTAFFSKDARDEIAQARVRRAIAATECGEQRYGSIKRIRKLFQESNSKQ